MDYALTPDVLPDIPEVMALLDVPIDAGPPVDALISDEDLAVLLAELDSWCHWGADLLLELEVMEMAGPQTGIVSVTDYAKLRGETRAAVYRALSEGRIHGVPGSNPVRIDVEQADKEWEQTTRPAFASAEEKPASAAKSASPTPRARTGTDSESLLRARLANELLKAKRTRIELEQMQGKLAPRADIEQAFLDVIADAKAALEVIPVRVCDRLVGLDRQAIRAMLTTEIENALRGLTNGCTDPTGE